MSGDPADAVTVERDLLLSAHGLVRIDCFPDVRLGQAQVIACTSESDGARDHVLLRYDTPCGVVLQEGVYSDQEFALRHYVPLDLACASVRQWAADEARVREITAAWLDRRGP